MLKNKKGKLFVISGPSGAGKSSLIEDALKNLPGFVRSVSVTTRPARKNEQHGRKYIYITDEQFKTMAGNNELMECASYCDFSYGTPANMVEEELNKGNNVILEIEVQGALQVKKKRKKAYMIFITTPNIGILEERLKKRDTEPEAEIKKRLKTAIKEFEYQKYYDCIIINNNYNEALLNLIHILKSQKEC